MQTKWNDKKKENLAQMLINYWRFGWRWRGRFALALQGGLVRRKRPTIHKVNNIFFFLTVRSEEAPYVRDNEGRDSLEFWSLAVLHRWEIRHRKRTSGKLGLYSFHGKTSSSSSSTRLSSCSPIAASFDSWRFLFKIAYVASSLTWSAGMFLKAKQTTIICTIERLIPGD